MKLNNKGFGFLAIIGIIALAGIAVAAIKHGTANTVDSTVNTVLK